MRQNCRPKTKLGVNLQLTASLSYFYTMKNTLNLLGLLLITIGGIGASLCTPAPQYNADGSVSLSGNTEKAARIRLHHRQKWLSKLLMLVGIGAILQAAASLLSE